MNARIAHLLVCLYPRSWRQRYGAEFETLLQTGRGGLGTMADVVQSALGEHISSILSSILRGTMSRPDLSFNTIRKRPSAFLPLIMSLTALALLLGHLAIYGIPHDADEGSIAHIWQILMAGQAPILAFFAIKWLPRAPKQTLYVLGLQAGAAAASVAPVFFLNL